MRFWAMGEMKSPVSKMGAAIFFAGVILLGSAGRAQTAKAQFVGSESCKG